MENIRTRYAPSPTGRLHIGGARTALFSYLFAKHFNGTFVVRIEDTDIERNIQDGEKSQIENLEWLGIIADESPLKVNPQFAPYRQSEKFARYYQIAQGLIHEGKAYKAYDTAEELAQQKEEALKKGHSSFHYDKNWLTISEEERTRRDQEHQYAIRISTPKNRIYQWDDLVRGKIHFKSSEIGDWVIIKSNKIATYNFAVVVDDHDMQISHVFRGEEHITNTPRQLMIYELLNWQKPQFGHFTIITNEEGKKLSKRDLRLKQFISDYKEEGYHPQGIFNFLTLLGYTDFEAREKLPKDLIVKRFDPRRFSKSPSFFDIEKMKWFSKKYWHEESIETIKSFLNTYDYDENWIGIFMEAYKDGFYSIKELQETLDYYYLKAKEVLNFSPFDERIIQEFIRHFWDQEFTPDKILEAVKMTSQNLQVKGRKLYHPIRRATTYHDSGPQLSKAIYLLGEKEIKERLAKWR